MKDGTARGDVFIVHRITFVTDITDFKAIDTAAIIEQSLKAYTAISGNGHITKKPRRSRHIKRTITRARRRH